MSNFYDVPHQNVIPILRIGDAAPVAQNDLQLQVSFDQIGILRKNRV